jgi:diguanylate cyclase (GGDEF)-like protein/PAS domain S-box-containing protein
MLGPKRGHSGSGLNLVPEARDTKVPNPFHSEMEWKALFDTLDDAIMILDENCRILMANKATADFLGLSLENILGKFCYRLVHDCDRPVPGCPLMKMFDSGKCEMNEQCLSPEGVWKRITVYPSPRDEQGSSRFVHIIRNIKNEKKINDALSKRMRELNCLYALSRLIETKGGAVEEILKEIPGMLISALRFPDAAAAKLCWDGKEYATSDWKDTPWTLRKDIIVSGWDPGSLQVGYKEKKADFGETIFLKEEENLLQAISKRLGHVIEYKKAEDALRENEEMYRIHFENISDVNFSLDPDLKIKNISPSVERFLGYMPEELIGNELLDSKILGSDSRELVLEDAGKLFSGEHIESSLYRFIHKDGRTVLGEVSSTPLVKDGQVLAIISVARDVSARHRTEQELKYTATLLETQQQTALDGILVVDEKDEIISYNQRFIDIWNLPKDIVESRSNERAMQYVYNIVENADEANAVVRHLYEHSSEKSQDELFLKDGRTLDRYSAPMVSEDGHYYGRVWYFRDITEYKEAEERVVQANKELVATVTKLKEKDLHNSILREMREMLQACSSVKEVPSIIRGSMSKLFPHASGSLFMMSASRLDLEAVIHWDDVSDDVDDNIFTLDACWALRLGRVHLVESPSSGPICPHLKHPLQAAYVCLPLVAKGDVLGLLHLRGKTTVSRELQKKTLSDLKELSSTISEYLSLSIANIRLSEKLASQSVRDPLTGLFNRRYMMESLQREILRAERKNTTIGIVMADIDHFKQFNDKYGHAAGDELLMHVGNFLKSKIRRADVACRYGGEEFILFLPESSLDDTYQRMEEILEGVQSLVAYQHGSRLASITLSLGIAVYPDHGRDAETLLKVADTAMYRAKQAGRNRIAAG